VTDGIELSIVMPCLNVAATLAGCIEKARIGIERSGVRVLRENGSLLLIEPGFLSAGS
jgi:hypothetical protein